MSGQSCACSAEVNVLVCGVKDHGFDAHWLISRVQNGLGKVWQDIGHCPVARGPEEVTSLQTM
ncbi:hypothetical protein ACTXT7_006620 [Hymenolepis weldensis]